MQKRRSGSDIFLFVLLILIFIMVVLAMVQIDRQWQKLTAMEKTLQEQSRDVSSIRSTISQLQRQLSQVDLATKNTSQAEGANIDLSNQVDGNFPDAFRRVRKLTENKDYAQGGWSVGSFGSNLKTISPIVSQDVYASQVQGYVIETLLVRDPDTLGWAGLLASSWQSSEDGLTLTFTLKEEAAFSDGQPLTAEDVVFSFDFIMDERIDAPRQRAYYEKIDRVTALDPHTVEFVFKEPYFEALVLAGTLEVLAKHFYERYYDEPQTFNQSTGILFGSGPYRLEDPTGWTPDKSGVELVRNNRYWGAVQPSFDRIMWKVIANDSARLTTYRNGDIDGYSARPIEYSKLKEDKQITDKSQHFEYMSPIAGYSYLGWNQLKEGKPTKFADKRVRQAMTYLTDRTRIIEDIYLGYAEIAISPFSPRSKQHDTTLQPRDYDLNKAKSLLKEAGYEDTDGDGILNAEDGEPFQFELVYFQDNPDTKRMVLLLKDTYAKAGIKLIPSPQEWPVMLELLDKKNFDAITLAWSSGIETDIYQMFHGSQSLTKGDNFVSYRSDKLDKLIDEARAMVDEDKRMPLWKEAERVMYDEQPYTFLTRRKSLLFMDKRIGNLQLTNVGLNLGTSVSPLELYVPAIQQKYSQ